MFATFWQKLMKTPKMFSFVSPKIVHSILRLNHQPTSGLILAFRKALKTYYYTHPHGLPNTLTTVFRNKSVSKFFIHSFINDHGSGLSEIRSTTYEKEI